MLPLKELRIHLTRIDIDNHEELRSGTGVVNTPYQEEELSHKLLKPMNTPQIQCPICWKIVRRSYLKTHFSKKHTADECKPFQCNICQRLFVHPDFVTAHMKKSHHIGITNADADTARYVCNFCNAVYSNSGNLTEHLRSHTKERPLKCQFCPATFGRYNILAGHTKTHDHNRSPITCGSCSKTFCSNWSLSQHERQIHCKQQPKPHLSPTAYRVFIKQIATSTNLVPPFKCQFCEKLCPHAYSLVIHVGTHTKGKNSKLVSHEEWNRWKLAVAPSKNRRKRKLSKLGQVCNEPKFPKPCEVCGKLIRGNGVALLMHMRAHTRAEPDSSRSNECNVCGRKFSKKWNRQRHELRHERHHRRGHGRGRPSISQSVLKCKFCLKSFTQPHVLRVHMSTHKERSYKCQHCDETVREWPTSGLGDQEPPHNCSDKEFVCEICGRRCKDKAALSRHVWAHDAKSERPFKCDHPGCQSGFRCSFGLRRHKLSMHTPKEHHKCKFCRKRFLTSDELDTHFMAHTEKRPYSCQFCDYATKRKQELRVHQQWKHSDGRPKPHECHICHKRFISVTELKRHGATHSDERPFPCPQCKHRLKRKYDLKIHQRSHNHNI